MMEMMRMRPRPNQSVPTRIASRIVLATTFWAASLFAQAPGDSKAIAVSKVERKNLAPVSKEILKVNLPKPVEATLSNGVTVLILEDHRFPNIAVDFTIAGAGGLWDAETERGLAGA